ncbi:MAG: hypothetical protein M9909_07620 [Thermomicrobiales bacterium]|nr:hypothetical protein [Thermomicrobiales bacterium]
MHVELRIGDHWAYRIGKRIGTPAFPVEVLQFGPETSKHKVKVKYLGGEYAGLDEWVPKTRLVVPWESHDAWWEEQRNQLEAIKLGEPASDDEYMAVLHVFAAYEGEAVFSTDHRTQTWGLLEVVDEEAALEALAGSGIRLEELPGYYRNSSGSPRASWSATLEIAQYLCRAFSSKIAESVERDLRLAEWRTIHGHQVGKTYFDPESCKRSLEWEKPIFDLVFSWCDVQDVARLNRERALEDEVTRLRELVSGVVKDYRSTGHPQLAARLEKQIRVENPTD